MCCCMNARMDNELLDRHSDQLVEQTLEMAFGDADVRCDVCQQERLAKVCADECRRFAHLAQMRQALHTLFEALHRPHDANHPPLGVTQRVFVSDDPVWHAVLVEPDLEDVP